MPPKRKVAAAKVNKDASPSKITKDEKTEETPKPSEAESATEKLCSSQSEMASPEQDRTGETVTSLQREEEEMEEKLKQKRKWLLEQTNNILELLARLHRPDFDEEYPEEDLLDWIMDFVIVFLDYVKVLKKRRMNIFRQMLKNSSSCNFDNFLSILRLGHV